ncbi:IS607 family transposase [Bifidobacterium pseudolongum]|jgi:putative resolvase|uniref:Integrase n=1 Tax=Bifidobacterium pseudolongum subsp. globosum TaxID=1690 RepID=A0A4Q5AUA0_9BIFI|nr:IS607 family transposase [Bifidobacterium pseudolongum]MBS6344584.1 IS607 family transposase [Bifidobacterium pseudolongum]MCH4842648.1 IS607 family transposase [Bifidobacterium pseudolongum]MCI1193992.1 IS607 family transposase [Bifidobacterium pseudolongum subsp. globosum]MCI8754524.1 IS607 family transposase [Bifidobacterium pseudolongum]RYQ07727.1 integrase [Bifidobacterium pseudolongum subsp. globosum]
MLVKEWAEREHLHPQTVWKWCRTGKMPVPVERTPSGMWLVHDPKYETPVPSDTRQSRTVCYARVSSAGQKADLQRQADRLKAFALSMGVEAPEIVTETGSGMDDKRRKLKRLLADPTVGMIIVEHRDRLARMNAGLVESALKAQGRRIIVVDDTESDDDLVRDMTDALTSFCARLYGRRAVKNKVQAALRAAEDA